MALSHASQRSIIGEILWIHMNKLYISLILSTHGMFNTEKRCEIHVRGFRTKAVLPISQSGQYSFVFD